MKQRIFLYGTLKRGGRYSHHMTGQNFIGVARTEPRYRMVDCGDYPGIFPVDRNGASIHGEVWDVDEVCRARLDELEDVADRVYALEDVCLLPPFARQAVKTYFYLLDVSGRPDAGDDWRV